MFDGVFEWNSIILLKAFYSVKLGIFFENVWVKLARVRSFSSKPSLLRPIVHLTFTVTPRTAKSCRRGGPLDERFTSFQEALSSSLLR